MFFDKALERAKFLDSYLEKEGKPLGPLHGLPISLKVDCTNLGHFLFTIFELKAYQDSFNIKGVPSTLGYVAWIKNGPSAIDSALVQILLSQGAVLYVKTNIPQTLMVTVTENICLTPSKLISM
jgi:amidase